MMNEKSLDKVTDDILLLKKYSRLKETAVVRFIHPFFVGNSETPAY